MISCCNFANFRYIGSKNEEIMRILILTAAVFLCTNAFTQHFEAGLMVGASNYLGDLSANSSKVYLKESHFAGGIFGRYNINDFVAARLGFNYGIISGKDANADDAPIRERNLSFRSNLIEVGLTAEFNILGYQPYNLYRPFSPYIFAGVAFYHFNPKAEYQFQTVKLQPLGTEGQGMEGRPDPYQLSGISIPFGIGVKYAVTDKLNLGLEVGARKTFTDYIDDVSSTYVEYQALLAANGELAAALGNRTGEFLGTEPISVPTGTVRGDDTSSDWYFFAGLTISYNFLDNGLVGSRSRGKKRSGCKT